MTIAEEGGDIYSGMYSIDGDDITLCRIVGSNSYNFYGKVHDGYMMVAEIGVFCKQNISLGSYDMYRNFTDKFIFGWLFTDNSNNNNIMFEIEIDLSNTYCTYWGTYVVNGSNITFNLITCYTDGTLADTNMTIAGTLDGDILTITYNGNQYAMEEAFEYSSY